MTFQSKSLKLKFDILTGIVFKVQIDNKLLIFYLTNSKLITYQHCFTAQYIIMVTRLFIKNNKILMCTWP